MVASTSTTSVRPPMWRRGALGRPGYPRYLIAMMQGATGWWVAKIAQDWLLLQLTGNLSAMGLAASLQFAPILIFGLFGGVLADRFNVRLLVIGGQLFQVVTSSTLAVLAITDLVRPWHIFVGAGLIGLGQVLEQPGRASTIAQLSGPHISQALSLNSIAFQSAGFWGPAASAALVALAGPGPAFACNAIGCVITIALLWRVPTADPKPGTGSKVSLRDGLSSMRDTTEIGWTMVMAAILALLALNMPLVYADMANRQFHTGVDGYSLFNSMSALGCIIGSMLAARIHSPRLRLLASLLIVLAVLMVVAGLTQQQTVFAVVVPILSLTSVTFQLLANALVQLAVDPAARGRVMGLYSLIVFGGMSLAGPVVGAVVQAIGGRVTLYLIGALLLVLTSLTGVLIARFTGQSLTVGRTGVGIKEPEVPRHVRLAQDALNTATQARTEAETKLARIDAVQDQLRDPSD